MALLTRNPTANQTPDATLGGNAVTDVTNTGHGSTVTASSAPDGATDSDEKSARWFTFVAGAGLVTAVRLKMSWLSSGSVTTGVGEGGGPSNATAQFLLQYSVNGGSNWTNIVNEQIAAQSIVAADSDSFTNNSSADIDLGVTQDITQVQVRADYVTTADSALAGDTADASVTATISDIRIEITIADSGAPIVMM